jgi:hypothetical protein
MTRLDPLLERAVRNAWREREHWGAYGVDNFINHLATELERERSNEARRSVASYERAA